MKINKVYARLFPLIQDPQYRYFEIYGGRRSAKSFDISQIITYIAVTQANHFCIILRKVARSLKDSVYARYKNNLVDSDIEHTENKTEKEFTLSNGSRIRCMGLDDPEKLKSLENADIIHFEEATEFSESDFDTLDAGLTPKNYDARIFLTHNPIPLIPGQMHWLQKKFLYIEHEMSVPAKGENFIVLKTWYKDNAFCPAATKKLLESYKKTNRQLYEMWALGNFTKLEGVILENWDVVSEVPENVECWGYGLDFGFSIDPAACLQIWGTNTELWVKAIVYHTGLSNKELFNMLIENGVDRYAKIIADSAEPKTIEDLRRRGLAGIRGVKKRANYKAEIANVLKSYEKIHLIQNIDLEREFSMWSWDRDKNDKLLPRPADGNDHLVDALIMLIHDRRGGEYMSIPEVSI